MSVGIIPDEEVMDASATRPQYLPPRIEKEILSFVENEYQQNRSMMGTDLYRIQTNVAMYNGNYIHDPGRTDPISRIWIPFTARAQRTTQRVHLRRLIPDPFSLNFPRVRMTDDPSPEFRAQYSQMLGVAPQEVRSEIEGVLTSLFLRYLRNSNLYSWAKKVLKYRQREGFSVNVVEKKYEFAAAPDDEPLVGELPSANHPAPDAEMEVVVNPDGTVDITPEKKEDDDDAPQARFVGLNFVAIPPINLTIGDLNCNEGVQGLPSFGVYQRRTYRHLSENEMVKGPDGIRQRGCYVNLEYLRPSDMGSAPSENDIDSGTVVGAYQATYMGTGYFQQGPANKSFRCRQRLGQFHMEDIDNLCKNLPTNGELKAFCKKFGITMDDLKTKKNWIVEWTSAVSDGQGTSNAPAVLIRFEPWTLPVDPRTGSLVIETRYWTVDNKTLAIGDYAISCGDLEVMANQYSCTIMENTRRIGEPMYLADMERVDDRYRQKNGDKIVYEPNAVILANTMGATRPMMEPIHPQPIAVEMAQLGLSFCLGQIDMFVGSTSAMQGNAGDGKATNALISDDWLKQQVEANNLDVETEAFKPALEQALAFVLEEIKSAPFTRVVIPKEDLQLFGDRYKEYEALTYIITPDMIMHRWGVEIMTASSVGSMEDRLTRVERFVAMVQPLEERLMQGGKQVNWAGVFTGYANDIGIVEPFVDFIMPPGIPPMAGGGGNPGGAGTPRPDYNRTATETSAPGEPMPGEQQPGHAENVTRGMMQHLERSSSPV